LLDAAGLASLAAVNWFETVGDAADHAGTASWTAEDTIVANTSGDASDSQANIFDWIVQFDTAALTGVTCVADTLGYLTGNDVVFEVLSGLGMVGMVLVRSSGASYDTVVDCLSENVYLTSFEQDAFREADVRTGSSTTSTWAQDAIDASEAWTITTGSSSVVVGVIDTGVDYTHTALRNSIWVNPGEIASNGRDDDGNGFVDDVYGYDFVNNDGNPMDDNGHGTHVAGIITSVADCSIMVLKFLDSDGSGYLSDAIRAVNYATMMKSTYGANVCVTNNSWGGGSFSTALQTAILNSNSANILFVAAAGNESSNNDSAAQYPSGYNAPNVIAVAATTQYGALASYSNYGATSVDIAAPGSSILSTTPKNTYSTYSGTSMAPPYVSAVAALAWSLVPTATVAQVRDAILQGADPMASLRGKVAAGGELNAYNTLSLLLQNSAPLVGSLTVSAGSVMAGASVTLCAQGISNATSVSFYRDTNNNGQYDAGDQLVGSTGSIANGQASITLNTSGLSAGTYRYFARASGGGGQWSAAATATLAVLPADDFGNSAAASSPIAVPSSTSGTLGVAGDVDWFRFDAVAGTTYVFTVQLGTLSDSVLQLYSRNGTTLLASNDDYGSTCASQIQWTAAVGGTYYLAVAGYGNALAGSYVLTAQTQGAAPTLAEIDDQTMTHSQTTLTISLGADGVSTYTAQAVTYNAVQQTAYDLDQSLGLYKWRNYYFYNARGLKEKYVFDANNQAYIILPNGELYAFVGSVAKGRLVATLTPDYYINPALLHDAPAPSYSAVDSRLVSVSISNGLLTITRSKDFLGEFSVLVTAGNGVSTIKETFKVTATNAAPTLAAIDNQSMEGSQTSLTVSLDADDADGDALNYSTTVLTTNSVQQTAYDLDQSLGLYKWRNYYFYNARGLKEKYVFDANNQAYIILPNGELYAFVGNVAKGRLVATLTPDYYNNPALLHDAPAPSYTCTNSVHIAAGVVDGVLTISRDASYTHDFYVQVIVSDGLISTSRKFRVSVGGSASSSSWQEVSRNSETTAVSTTSLAMSPRTFPATFDAAATWMATESCIAPMAAATLPMPLRDAAWTDETSDMCGNRLSVLLEAASGLASSHAQPIRVAQASVGRIRFDAIDQSLETGPLANRDIECRALDELFELLGEID